MMDREAPEDEAVNEAEPAIDDSVDIVAGPLIVGIGASAGGLDAYKEFFGAMPSDSGIAFVLVQHLDPTYESALAEIIGGCTSMQVVQAVDGTVAAPNTVSVIPPNAILKIERGVLRVAKPETTTARRSSVDTFLMSLAHDQRDNAVGIILSGYGSDGTVGIGAIKEHGGLTLSEASFDHRAKAGMPQSAASTGFVDSVLQPQDMPAALMEHARYRANLVDLNQPEAVSGTLARHLVTICTVVHSRLGRDFGQYKTSTLTRRVKRRMQVLRIEDPLAYIDQLRKSPEEPEALFREMLISVTQFFRDPSVFEQLGKTVIPALLARGNPEDPVRVWVAGCATGEEAYTLAILFKEAAIEAESARRVTIFATDLDDQAVALARTGLYSDGIEANISAERLEHHFTKEGDRYRVAKHIREMCLFSTHDLVKDPPFSKLDMVSCRNLLIYFENELQQRVLSTFHYALNSDGILVLGPSENIIFSGRFFHTLNKRARIFRRLATKAEMPRLAAGGRGQRVATPTSEAPTVEDQAARILSSLAPAYIVLNGRYEIQRFSGQVAKFMEPVSGGASLELFQMLHSELHSPARALLRQAVQQRRQAQELRSFKVNGRSESVNLIAEALTESDGGPLMILLAFQDRGFATLAESALSGATDPEGGHGELLAAREQLQTVTEELETANEELQSSNEEFQSVNEELHSTVEELETSKEELQSINEELQTVNLELNVRAESLVRSNSDLVNLFDSTSIATLFLDHRLCIRRFTPAIVDIFNVRPGDEGRPITDFSSRLAFDGPERDARAVLKNLATIERELQTPDRSASYLMRIKPYRDLNNVIDGVVITFIDITERQNHERARARLAAIVESSEDAIIGHRLDGIITSWNLGAEKIFGYESSEIVGKSMSRLLGRDQFDEWPDNLARLQQGEVIKKIDITRLNKDGQPVEVSLSVSPIREGDVVVGASAVARDISERRAAEAQAALLMAELDHRVKNILAVTSSVVSQTLKAENSSKTAMVVIEGRINAIARAHALLTGRGGVEGSLRDLVETELAPYRQIDNLLMQGDDVALTAEAGLTMALAIHELATNAAKYGALSVPEGRVSVTWSVSGLAAEPVLEFVWLESGGPVVVPPTRRGFGSRLIELSVEHGLGASVRRDFLPEGMEFRLKAPFAKDIGRLRANIPREGEGT